MSKDEALAVLRAATKKDFGSDAAAWRRWLQRHDASEVEVIRVVQLRDSMRALRDARPDPEKLTAPGHVAVWAGAVGARALKRYVGTGARTRSAAPSEFDTEFGIRWFSEDFQESLHFERHGSLIELLSSPAFEVVARLAEAERIRYGVEKVNAIVLRFHLSLPKAALGTGSKLIYLGSFPFEEEPSARPRRART
ncbi:MAG TPA: immunity 22 family protein [Planctomycetota bacterium]|nr:immunity 22 family protein [Planctomycetota bacterium]